MTVDDHLGKLYFERVGRGAGEPALPAFVAALKADESLQCEARARLAGLDKLAAATGVADLGKRCHVSAIHRESLMGALQQAAA